MNDLIRNIDSQFHMLQCNKSVYHCIYRWHSGAVVSTDASQLEGSGKLGAGVCMFSLSLK